MEFITELLHNRIFVSAALGWMVAQVLKTIIHMILTKQFVAERMVGSGGMPSSHSATVCALATATGMECGAGSPEFAITIMLAIIVMYDAMGVRRETGEQAKILNKMIQNWMDLGAQSAPILADRKLKEMVGHTPIQVISGAILGFAVGFLFPMP